MNFLRRLFGKKGAKSAIEETNHFDQYRSELAAEGLSSIDDLERLVNPLILDATKIVVHPASRPPDKSQMKSHFGGDPFFEQGETWPTVDGKPLSFICQFYDLEGQFFPDGVKLVQFFFDQEELAFETDDQGWLVKVYSDTSKDKSEFLEKPAGLEKSKYCEVSFEPTKSLPRWEEIDRHGDQASKLSCVLNEGEPWGAYDSVVTKLAGEHEEGSQIGGYPMWIQGDETPNTSDGKVMKLFFQIDSEEKAGLMWGDVGLIYIFFDPDNARELGFVFQCC